MEAKTSMPLLSDACRRGDHAHCERPPAKMPVGFPACSCPCHRTPPQPPEPERADYRLRAFVGAINLRIFVPILARDLEDAEQRLGRLDIDDALDTARFYEVIQDEAERFFYAEEGRLSADGDTESEDAQ